MVEDGFAAAVRTLYAVPPADFVATRASLVRGLKSEGAKEVAAQVAALRKPSAAAYAVNTLAQRGDLDDLADLGQRFRAAQSRLDAAAMKELAAERTRVIAGLVRRAAEEEGLSAATQTQVNDTFVASIASADAQAAVLSGALVNPLVYSGFGEVDVSDAVAAPHLRLVPTPREVGESSREVSKSSREVSDSPREVSTSAVGADAQRRASALAAAERALTRARTAATDARADAERADERVGRAQSSLEAARRTVESAERTLTDAETKRDAAQRKVHLLAAELADAQAVVDALQEPHSGMG